MSSTADEILRSCSVPGTNLYFVGTFDSGITLISQQIRALNLVWALTEKKIIPSLHPGEKSNADYTHKIAIVGGGFAGLTAAAGLIRKGAKAELTVFEQRDTLLPLQHGSDTRWLHPNIYNWPAERSQANAAMLPVINWTAARASDVVVQVTEEWRRVVQESQIGKPLLYCNTRHLQISAAPSGKKLQVEWVGEARDAISGNPANSNLNGDAVGRTCEFDLIIMGVGFGLEKRRTLSYWRNDTISQPNLEQPRLTYLVSGQGDGAMIDLLRLRISHFRQDRILGELFQRTSTIVSEIRKIYQLFEKNKKIGIFDAFELLQSHPDFQNVIDVLKPRLRRDTDVILCIRLRKISELFDSNETRISFQNKLLVYLLYKCGGFVPSSTAENSLIEQHFIPTNRIIRRHGSKRVEQLQLVLSESLFAKLKVTPEKKPYPKRYFQSDSLGWPGGYFGHSGTTASLLEASPSDPIRAIWRKEYLPHPTEFVASSFCSSLSGYLTQHHPKVGRLRITLHRAIHFGNEELLQQCCRYFGLNLKFPDNTVARTFPAKNATIGLAYKCRQIVRSRANVSKHLLDEAMKESALNAASSEMSGDVKFLLAIPILEPEEPGKFTAPHPVAGIVYIDSTADFFVDDKLLEDLISMSTAHIRGLEETSSSAINRIVNLPLSGFGTSVPKPEKLSSTVAKAFELVQNVSPPRTNNPFQFNFEYTDFVPIVD